MFSKMFLKFMSRYLYIKRKLRKLIQGECFKLSVGVPSYCKDILKLGTL